MSTFRCCVRLLSACALLLITTSCGAPSPTAVTAEPAAPSAVETPPDALAMVNSKAITRADMELALAAGGHEEDYSPERTRSVLENLIEQELIAQEAERLRLDYDPAYLEQLGKLQAQVSAFKRNALGEVYFRQEIRNKATVTEEQISRYFGENQQRIQTELHVKQILRKSQAAIDAEYARLQAGESFDAVAGRPFAGAITKGRQPWDLGFLKWAQIPDAWRPAVDELADGEVSGVLSNPSGRFWIIQIVERRVTDVSVEQMASVIENLLKKEALQARKIELKAARRAAATIEILPGADKPILPPAAPEEEP